MVWCLHHQSCLYGYLVLILYSCPGHSPCAKLGGLIPDFESHVNATNLDPDLDQNARVDGVIVSSQFRGHVG